ncbi:RtcB family protein [Reichenbachiella ulvae]|uniref:3'-phosphate/5'-hydroxy nucleic acid ligase n=1 Tax=Reichenbachiella ulvae TaxID=2980104 RepID=A0ABT3CQG6_9BACT|nr:RtcB family protein [Reichenbachiella ulvae]MCV9385941.1 RtcB family protein [Reichenbachiella ulvae]
MGNHKLRGKDLKAIAYYTSKEKSMALDITSKHLKHSSKEEKLQILSVVKNEPEQFLNDFVWSKLAEYFLDQDHEEIKQEIQLKEEAEPFRVFGRQHIMSNACQQMEWAMRLPIAVYGALMPDAHIGYGLPIGGVLATQNAVIPYGVGVDIGCRMSLSLFDVNPKYLTRNSYQFKLALKERTNFGSGGSLNII